MKPPIKTRPILFSDAMVRAILDGCKTQTRRIVKGETCPYGKQGDRLWVREAFARLDILPIEIPPEYGPAENYLWCYRASHQEQLQSSDRFMTNKIREARWKPGIHMPRAISRTTLEITSVRQERLQSISEDDAKEEGSRYVKTARELFDGKGERDVYGMLTARECFRELWDSINADRGDWNSNPLVWRICFRMIL